MEPFLANFTFNHVTILYAPTCADYFKHHCLLYSLLSCHLLARKRFHFISCKALHQMFSHVGLRKCNTWFISSTESCTKCQSIKTAVISIFLLSALIKRSLTFGSWDISSAHICICVESGIVQHKIELRPVVQRGRHDTIPVKMSSCTQHATGPFRGPHERFHKILLHVHVLLSCTCLELYRPPNPINDSVLG